jgi:hypothetical protein
VTTGNTATTPAATHPGFTALPNWMRGRFTPHELALIWCIQSYCPTERPSVGRLAEDAGLSVASVNRLMRVLERDGVLCRVPRYEESGFQLANGYEVRIWNEDAEAGTRGRRG